jgi:hypothetical protein
MTSAFCFATLALGKPYREMAGALANDLARFAPGKLLVIATDEPRDFAELQNVRAHLHQQVGLFRCINDKRFALAIALENYSPTVIFIDADTRVHQTVPAEFHFESPLVTTYTPNLAEQINKYLLPKESAIVFQIARKFGIDATKTSFVWDSSFAVSRDGGREQVFLQIWGVLTRLFDFRGAWITDGYCMALAAKVTGWAPSDRGLEEFDRCKHHAEISAASRSETTWARALRRIHAWLRWVRYRRQILRALTSD